jgi:hypothetical protein
MTMKTLKIAALTLALAASGAAMAATDGTLGTTSTGSFNASLQVNAPAGTQVQVFGLDDFAFPAVTGGITTNTPVPAIEQPFCLNRSTAGNVLVTISQTGNAGSFNLNDGAGHTLNLSMVVTSPVGSGGSSTGPANGGQFTVPQSNAGCTAASNNTVAHTLRLSPGTVLSQTGGQAYGNFSGAFTVLVSAQ